MRVFLAVNLQAELQEELTQIQERLRQKIKGVRWVAPSLLHITLKFLGELDNTALGILEKPLREIGEKTAAFTVSLNSLGAFPSLNTPRVFWIGIDEGALQLSRLAGKIERCLGGLKSWQGSGNRKTTEQFRSHITIGRRKKKSEQFMVAGDVFDELWACKNKLLVDSFHLMQSKLYPTGPVYIPVKKFLFKENKENREFLLI